MALILTVDDEEDIRFLVKTNLELDGHRVETAANGIEALDFVRRSPPDVLILDVMMPDANGFDVLTEIKAASDAETQNIPVIMLSAMGDDGNRLRSGIEGAVTYLVKPFDADDLRSAVDEALRSDEPEVRRQVQRNSLTRLAEIEKGGPPSLENVSALRLTRLERQRGVDNAPSRAAVEAAKHIADLTDKQRAILRVLVSAPTVAAGATELGISRSNIYASLRRVSRKLGLGSVPDLLDVLRRGELSLDMPDDVAGDGSTDAPTG